MTCIHHSVIRVVYTALKIVCSPIHPPAHPLAPVMLLFSFHSFAFSRMSQSWNHKVFGFFHSVIGIYVFSMSFHSSIAHLFLVLNNIPLSEWTSLLIHSPTEGHLGCFRVSTILNKATVNIPVQIFLWTCFPCLWINTKDKNC